MSVITLDTLKFAKRLKEAGVPEAQAEAQTEAMADAFEANLEKLATKADLRELELKIHAEMTLVKWMIGIVMGGVVSLIVKAFFS